MRIIIALWILLGLISPTQAQDLPEDVLKDAPEDMSKDVPEDVLKNVPEDKPKDIPEDVLKNVPEDKPKDVPEDVLKNVPEDKPKDIPEDVLKDVPEDMPKHVPEDVPEDKPKDYPNNVRKDVPIWHFTYANEPAHLITVNANGNDYVDPSKIGLYLLYKSATLVEKLGHEHFSFYLRLADAVAAKPVVELDKLPAAHNLTAYIFIEKRRRESTFTAKDVIAEYAAQFEEQAE